jgi:hypothetical protein
MDRQHVCCKKNIHFWGISSSSLLFHAMCWKSPWESSKGSTLV